MPSYLITGANRGIGFEFVRQLSSDSSNTVIGIVRDKAAAEATVAKELEGRKNIHILETDVTDYNGLKRAAEATAKITGGGLDYVISNAALIPFWSAFEPLGELGKEPERLEKELAECFNVNVIATVHLINLFIPLVLKGEAKKVITITTGFADAELNAKYNLSIAGPYSISKAAVNMVVAKYSAEYAEQGVLFLALAPGMVDTGNMDKLTPEQGQKAMGMMGKFKDYAPDFSGPITPEESVKLMRAVWDKASVANGDGGAFLSQFGNKQWL
ncbi:hypothetical protein LTR84_006935 [Exophiala bonariae]|uniref:NAD(P)-binding protein n=1 Tax=Exophiala bonariae TaxID=1690606 RepID=A0AAV9MZA5_9EURO|nr:hypothetical protein LTR84_006935 [Exophiala bonariae]